MIINVFKKYTIKWGTWQETGNYKENQKEILRLKNMIMEIRKLIYNLIAI